MNNGGNSGGGGGPGVKNPLFSLRRPLARATDSLAAAEKGGAGGGELYILGARNPSATVVALAPRHRYIYIILPRRHAALTLFAREKHFKGIFAVIGVQYHRRARDTAPTTIDIHTHTHTHKHIILYICTVQGRNGLVAGDPYELRP